MLTVTRLQVVRPLESGTGSVVLSASMKTPHRVLRSNQINLRTNGVLDVPLEWTYSLQVREALSISQLSIPGPNICSICIS